MGSWKERLGPPDDTHIVEWINKVWIRYKKKQKKKRGSKKKKNKTRADWSSDHELLIAKFRLKLKKVGKTTRPLSNDLNQIPYDYTVEVTNRFKGLDLIDRVPEEL